ncbi:MAG: riboflavin synthase, partial [candidate division WOR-3 bacterium]
MFTGLVETLGRVEKVEPKLGNRRLAISAGFASELKTGDSVAVNGCCLTVVGTGAELFTVEAVAATLEQTTLGRLKTGQRVNLERALEAGARMGGHFVQGHVDEVGRVRRLTRRQGWHELAIEVKRESLRFTVPKGSVCVDGVSLTIAEARPGEFSVNIVPHTWDNTTLSSLRPGELA